MICLWTGSEVLKCTEGSGNADWQASGVSIDTRTIAPGDLFIAIKGPNFDGHEFIQEAFDKGAAAVLIQQSLYTKQIDSLSSRPIIIVRDTLTALKDLAYAARKRFKGKILALTGSVGKTTIKEWLYHVLSAQKDTFASFGSFNNHIGLPLSLSRLSMDAFYGIFELGMNHAGEIKSLTELLKPDVVMISNVFPQHIGNFSSLEEIVMAKSEIFTFSPKLAIVSRDSPHYDHIKSLGNNVSQWMTFGVHEKSDIRLVSAVDNKDIVKVTVRIYEKEFTYLLPSLGQHWIMNSLAVLAGAVALKANIEQTIQSLITFMPVAGRGQRIHMGGITVIDDSYNAAPPAMIAALTTFANLTAKGKKYLVLGEMRELGQDSLRFHDDLFKFIVLSGAHTVWLCGEYMSELSKKLPNAYYGKTIHDVIPHVLSTLCSEDKILIKGGRSMKTFLLVDALYRYYGMDLEADVYPLRAYF